MSASVATAVKVELTHIIGGSGKKFQGCGQGIYNAVIPIFATLYENLAKGKGKFLDCLYEGFIAGGAIFLAPDKERSRKRWAQLSPMEKKNMRRNKLSHMVYTPMDPKVAREQIRAAMVDYKNKCDPYLHEKKKEAEQIFRDVGGIIIDINNYKKWRVKITQLYEEEFRRHVEEQTYGMHDSTKTIMVVEKEDMEGCASLLLLNSGYSMSNSKKAKDAFDRVRSAYSNNPPNPLSPYISTLASASTENVDRYYQNMRSISNDSVPGGKNSYTI